MEPKSLVIERTGPFTAEDVIALVRGDVLAIRTARFASRESCGAIARNLLACGRIKYYPHAPEIGKAFNAFYEGHADSAIRSRYYKEVAETTRLFRQLSWPFLDPIDHLRLIIHDAWPSGAGRENIHGKPMSLGLVQIFKKRSCALPHMDFLRMDEPENQVAQTLLTQITAIIYIQPADEGGELELWREHYDREEFIARKNIATYGLDYAKLPPPSVVIRPGTGDLVLADSTRVHAVGTVAKGVRIAVNCFVGFRGIDRPLTYWS